MQTLPTLTVSIFNNPTVGQNALLFLTYYNQVEEKGNDIGVRICLSKDVAFEKDQVKLSPRTDTSVTSSSNLLDPAFYSLSIEFDDDGEGEELFIFTSVEGQTLKFLCAIKYPEGQTSTWEFEEASTFLLINELGNIALTSIYWDYIHLKASNQIHP